MPKSIYSFSTNNIGMRDKTFIQDKNIDWEIIDVNSANIKIEGDATVFFDLTLSEPQFLIWDDVIGFHLANSIDWAAWATRKNYEVVLFSMECPYTGTLSIIDNSFLVDKGRMAWPCASKDLGFSVFTFLTGVYDFYELNAILAPDIVATNVATGAKFPLSENTTLSAGSYTFEATKTPYNITAGSEPSVDMFIVIDGTIQKVDKQAIAIPSMKEYTFIVKGRFNQTNIGAPDGNVVIGTYSFGFFGM